MSENKKENDKIKTENINDTYKFEVLFELKAKKLHHSKTVNTFNVFNSINNILCLIYSNDGYSIVLYNLIDNKKMTEIKIANDEFISTFRHILDKNNKRDLIISISDPNNSLKLWNINKCECLFYLKNIYQHVNLFSACFLNDNNNNQIYIITGNSVDIEPFKLFDLNGSFVKDIININEYVVFIDIYYKNKPFIISGNFHNVQSIDYYENKIYHVYKAYEGYLFLNVCIKEEKEKIKIIGSSCNGYINIWDFCNGEILNLIEVNSFLQPFCFCFWDDNYLIVGNNDYNIELIHLKEKKPPIILFSHINLLFNIEKIIHPKFGICLVCKDAIGRIFIYNQVNNNSQK